MTEYEFMQKFKVLYPELNALLFGEIDEKYSGDFKIMLTIMGGDGVLDDVCIIMDRYNTYIDAEKDEYRTDLFEYFKKNVYKHEEWIQRLAMDLL